MKDPQPFPEDLRAPASRRASSSPVGRSPITLVIRTLTEVGGVGVGGLNTDNKDLKRPILPPPPPKGPYDLQEA